MTAREGVPRRATELALALRADLAAVELFGVLTVRSLEALLLRGPTIARRLYGDGERGYADCDVLVPDANWQPVASILSELGYSPQIALPTEQHWRRTVNGSEIDLHRTLYGANGSTDSVWRAFAAHAMTLELGAGSVRSLDTTATALVIALHAAQHGMIVAHPLTDLERALAAWDADIWRKAVALSTEMDSTVAFKQGLGMVEPGRERLAELGLEPSFSVRATLRRRGVEVPYYLFETLSFRERLGRIVLTRQELAMRGDPRIAPSTPRLLLANVSRWLRFPFRLAILAIRALPALFEIARWKLRPNR